MSVCKYHDVSGDTREIEASFDAARKAIGGYIEVVRVNGGVLLVDEEGLLKRLPLNTEASLMAGRALVGGAVFVPKNLVKEVLG